MWAVKSLSSVMLANRDVESGCVGGECGGQYC
jgi:hypothetical protein